MKNNQSKWFLGLALTLCLGMISCQHKYEVTDYQGELVKIDAKWDANPSKQAVDLLVPYKHDVDSMMTRVVGTSALTMDARRPESLLSNLVADVLRESPKKFLNETADVAVINVGGLRNIINRGDVTCANVFEVLPFENSLTVLTLKGTVLRSLFQDLARRKGEGLSGAELKISKDGKLLDAKVGGKAIEDERLYKVATVDYLADGNDGMTSFLQCEKREDPEGATLRSIFMEYVEKQHQAGKPLTSKLENRIVMMGMGQAKPLELTLLHTSDMHSRIEPIDPASADRFAGLGGLIRRTAFVDDFRAKDPEVLLFDGGDFSQGTPYYNLFKGEVEIQYMNLMGYDAATIGNHEFDFGLDNMARLFKMAKFPIVCCNYHVEGTPLEGLVKPYVVLERAGLRIGVLGVGAKLAGLVQANKCEGIRYERPIEAVQRTVDVMRNKEKCDLVVCLSHMGIHIAGTDDDELIAGTTGIDVVLGGHTHTVMQKPETLLNKEGKNVPVFHCGSKGAYVAKLDLKISQID